MGSSSTGVELREQLVAILDAADVAMSTTDILRQLAAGGRNCASTRHPDGACAHGWSMPGGATCAAGCWYLRVYPQLRALKLAGVVDQVPRTARSRTAHWWLAGRQLAPVTSAVPRRFVPRRPATPRIVSVRRAVLAVVGAAGTSMSTNDVCRELPARLGCDQHRPECASTPGASGCERMCWYTTAYPQLCRLAQMGLLRHKPRFAEPMTREAQWSPIGAADSDAALNAALEEGL